MKEYDAHTRGLLSRALRALVLTRDSVGAEKLPAEVGWEWYQAGRLLAKAIPYDEWSHQFQFRVEAYRRGRAQ